MITTPYRTNALLYDAENLEKTGFYSSAILLYSHYLEQKLLLYYFIWSDKNSPELTKSRIRKLFEMKDEKHFTFGRILKFVEPSLITKNEVKLLCSEVKTARDQIGAHFVFMPRIDTERRTWRSYDDVSNYRKLIRRLYSLIRKQERIREVELFLTFRDRLSRYSNIEKDAWKLEQMLLKKICKDTRKNVETAVCLLYKKPPGPLEKYVSDR